MNKEIKQLWIEALRNGEYEQGFGYLCQTNSLKPDFKYSYCCLGVLMELYQKEFPTLMSSKLISPDNIGCDFLVKNYSSNNNTYNDSNNSKLLSEDVMIWAGISKGSILNLYTTEGEKSRNYTHSLVTINDNMRKSFNEIADLIEEQL